MASNTNPLGCLTFCGYCYLILALGGIPRIGWPAAELFRSCIPAHLRQRAARAYRVERCR